MKFVPAIFPSEFESPAGNEFQLPHGIIGFAHYKRAELLYQPENLPFLWMRLPGPEQIHFLVIEPAGIISGYEPEIFDEDAAQLGLNDPSQAMILNIVTLKHQQPVDATVNLIGPIVINRRTRVGRQLVISNYSRYSANHALVEQSQTPECARTA